MGFIEWEFMKIEREKMSPATAGLTTPVKLAGTFHGAGRNKLRR